MQERDLKRRKAGYKRGVFIVSTLGHSRSHDEDTAADLDSYSWSPSLVVLTGASAVALKNKTSSLSPRLSRPRHGSSRTFKTSVTLSTPRRPCERQVFVVGREVEVVGTTSKADGSNTRHDTDTRSGHDGNHQPHTRHYNR